MFDLIYKEYLEKLEYVPNDNLVLEVWLYQVNLFCIIPMLHGLIPSRILITQHANWGSSMNQTRKPGYKRYCLP